MDTFHKIGHYSVHFYRRKPYVLVASDTQIPVSKCLFPTTIWREYANFTLNLLMQSAI